MCHFIATKLHSHRAVAAYDYVWRLDSDSFILGVIETDFLADFAKRSAVYGYIAAHPEPQDVSQELGDLAVRQWLRREPLLTHALRTYGYRAIRYIRRVFISAHARPAVGIVRSFIRILRCAPSIFDFEL